MLALIKNKRQLLLLLAGVLGMVSATVAATLLIVHSKILLFVPHGTSPNAAYTAQLKAGSPVELYVRFPDTPGGSVNVYAVAPNGQEHKLQPTYLGGKLPSRSRQLDFIPEVGGVWQVRVEGVERGEHEVRITRTDKQDAVRLPISH